MKRGNDGIDVQGKVPGFWFYPADYLRALAPCSLTARGLWADCLCYMHFARRRGYLEHPNGNPITPAELARMTGGNLSQIERALAELERCGIYSRDDTGSIFNRRMVRDTEISAARKAAGRLGGNPHLVRTEDKQNEDLLKQNANLDNQNPNQNPTSSSSSSSSVKAKEKDPPVAPQAGGAFSLESDPPKNGNGKRAKKPKPEMTSWQQATFHDYLNEHPKNTVQTVSSRNLWRERVKDQPTVDFLMACLRRECAGNTQFMFGPGKWLADHLELYANGVTPAAAGDETDEYLAKTLRRMEAAER